MEVVSCAGEEPGEAVESVDAVAADVADRADSVAWATTRRCLILSTPTVSSGCGPIESSGSSNVSIIVAHSIIWLLVNPCASGRIAS